MTITNILVPFNLLVDTDMGLIKLIQYDYHNTEYFHEGIMDTSEINQQYTLITRTQRNPLSVLAKDTLDSETLDDLYDQFMTKEYDQILSLSCNTMISNLAVSLGRTKNSDILRIHALCASEKEANILSQRNINVYKTIIGTPRDVNMSKISALIVKDINDLDKFRYLHMVNIYIADYWFNITIDEDNPQPIIPGEIITKYGSENEFQIISVYSFKDSDLPLG